MPVAVARGFVPTIAGEAPAPLTMPCELPIVPDDGPSLEESGMITSAEQLVTAIDHVELSRVVTEHAWRVDHGRADTVHELYVDEGELIVPPTPLRGRHAIYEWGQRLMADSTWRTIRHVCSNMRFIAEGLYSAEGTTVMTVFMVAERSAATTVPWMVGEYHDRFVRTHDGWKLVSRRWVELFTRRDALT